MSFRNSWHVGFFLFFSLTNTKSLSGLAVNSHLSKQKASNSVFFSTFWRARHETQWGTELRELTSASDGDLSYSESGWSWAEMNINNIPSLNGASPFEKGKKTLDSWTQNVLWISGHWESGISILPMPINKEGDPGAGQKNSGKVDRFLAEFLTNSSEMM